MRPLADLLGDAFAVYVCAESVDQGSEISPKSVVREMIENARPLRGLWGATTGPPEGIVLVLPGTDAYAGGCARSCPMS